MKLKYVGPHDEVEVAGVHVVKRGEAFECDAELGKSLLEQPDNFESVTASKTKES